MRARWLSVVLAVTWALGVSGGGVAEGQVLGAAAQDRAVSGGKAYMARRGLKALGLTLMVPRRYAKTLVDEIQAFEEKTGIGVKRYVEVSEKEALERLREEAGSRSGGVDFFLAPPTVVPESAELGLLLPLDGFIRAGRPDVEKVAPAFRHGSRYSGKTYGLLADGAVPVLALRQDLTALPAERSAFKRKFGWEPDCPDTWSQWRQLAEFYTRESTEGKFSKYYGALSARSRGWGWRWWLQRYYSKGKLPFDERMTPTLESPEAVATTKEYIEIAKYMPDDSRVWTQEEAVSAFLQGNIFSILTYPSAARSIRRPAASAVAGKVKFCTVPGSLVEGGPFRRALQIRGAVWLINRYGRHPEAAYWLIQWLTSGTVSARLASKPGSAFTPHREDVLKDPKVAAAYTPQLLEIIAKLTQVAAPEILLVGAERYHEALDRNLFEALTAAVSPEEAMKRTAEAWKHITEAVGLKKQIPAWRSFREGLPKKDLPE
ncbi:MAG: carbohydrate ABC transporter substrate-binding protein [Candidatus Tectomicrobia bacterium]|nr:carbohydrate ABC transporter substrate-binding protein [Candidatus Tectomicrobia bacterium]